MSTFGLDDQRLFDLVSAVSLDDEKIRGIVVLDQAPASVKFFVNVDLEGREETVPVEINFELIILENVELVDSLKDLFFEITIAKFVGNVVKGAITMLEWELTLFDCLDFLVDNSGEGGVPCK